MSPAGFKLFTRDTAALVFGSLHLQRWAFDIELIYICQLMAVPMAVSHELVTIRHTAVHDTWSLAVYAHSGPHLDSSAVATPTLLPPFPAPSSCLPSRLAGAVPADEVPFVVFAGTTLLVMPNPDSDHACAKICHDSFGMFLFCWQEVAVNWREVPGSKLIRSKLDIITTSATMLRDMLCVRLCYLFGVWTVTSPSDLGESKKRR